MFIGRETEIRELNKRYESNRFECVVLYGRRRIGKTALINEFTKNKRTIHFQATQGTGNENLESFSEAIQALDHQGSGFSLSEDYSQYIYASFRQAFFEVKRRAENERLVLVIDEFPFLAEKEESISSLLQEMIDHHFKPQEKLMIILCGSSTSFMENQVLGYKSPLYGRRTAQIKLTSFSIWETKKMFPSYSPEDLFTIHAITNGIPMYLGYMTDEKTIDQNIVENFFTQTSYLFQEPYAFLLQELREPDRYNTIIYSIAHGAVKSGEIASKSDIKQTSLNKYISVLIELDIIEKETPITEKGNRKSLYRLKDSFFWFYYRFVRRYRVQIEKGNGEQVWQKLKVKLPEWLGYQFETLTREWCLKQNFSANLPIEFTEIGRWWGTNPILKSEEEVDLLALNDEKEALFVECKYRNSINIKKTVEDLKRKSQLFPQYKSKSYLLAVKSLEDKSKSTEAQLISLEDMVND